MEDRESGVRNAGLASTSALDITYQTATEEDTELISALIGSNAFQADGTGSLLPLSSRSIVAAIGKEEFFVARSGPALAGCASVIEYGGIAELRSLVVAPEFRGRGIARPLMDLCTQRAGSIGYSHLYALTNRTALSVFTNLGFKVVDTPPQKLSRDCGDCPLNSNSLCKEVAVVRDLRQAGR